MKSVLPWSWSAYEAYQTCPRQYYELKIARNYVTPDDADYILWGKEVHTAMELRVREDIPLPDTMLKFERIAAPLAAAPGTVYCELETAVDCELNACAFDSEDAWNRGIEDLLVVNNDKALSIDYKTGKEKKFSKQLQLSACRVFANFPAVQVTTTAFAWLATGKWTKATYTRDQLGTLWEDFFEGVQQMLWSEQNNIWPAKPSGLCKKSRRPGSSYMGCPVATCPHSEWYRK